MTWIKTVAYSDAEGRLKQLYDRIKGPDDNVDNIMMAHSLRPHSMEGHMAIYKAVLHHARNSLDKSFLETLGVWVSLLNRCAYCVDHHFAGLRRLLGDHQKADAIKSALMREDIDGGPFTPAETAALRYAAQLSRTPADVDEGMIEALRDTGLDDGQILEINQVVAYFAYANRTVLGLGCVTDGDVLGLSPNNADDSDDWSHR